MSNSTITLHDDSLDDIISILRGEEQVRSQEDRDAIAATIEAQR